MRCNPTPHERQACLAIRCEYCLSEPGERCEAYNGPDASTWPVTRPHVLRVYEWRRRVAERAS